MRRVLMTVVTVGVVIGLAGAPASAQTKVRSDKAGDAPSKVDIRSVKVQNNAKNFAVTVRMADVVKRRTSNVVFFGRPSGNAGAVTVETVPVSKGRYKFVQTRFDADGKASELKCAGTSVSILGGSRGYFRVVVPQSCLGALVGTQRTEVLAYDKQDLKGQQAGRLMRGDEGDADIDVDELNSPITTRRG